MSDELLDFEAHIAPKWHERLINYIQTIPIYKRILGIILFSMFNTLIISYKASKLNDPLLEAAKIWGGIIILLLIFGYCLCVLFIGSSLISKKIIGYKLKINDLDGISCALILAVCSFIALLIAAYFID